VIDVRFKSNRKPPRSDIWVTEIRVKKVSKALDELLKLVRKYEDLS